MLARFRLSVPDRPGMLGQVATAIGTAGGDIVAVDVLESGTGRALDDVLATVRDEDDAEKVRRALIGVHGVQVVAVQHPVPPASGHTELELLAQFAHQVVGGGPAGLTRGLRTLVDGAPGALGVDWAAILDFTDPQHPAPVVVSPACPGPEHITVSVGLRLAIISLCPPGRELPYQGVALVPLGGQPLGVLLVREEGPAWHRAELWRLEQFGKVVGAVLG